MKSSSENIDDLMAKVIAGEADKDELEIFEAWLSGSAENQRYFEGTKKLFVSIDSVNTETTVDVDAAWNKVNARISESKTKIIPLFKRPVILRAAGSILLLVTLGFVIKFIADSNTPEPVILATAGKVLEQKLPDGSKVFINKNSEIAYVVNKNHKREVKLKGEAYFEVIHNEKEPFVVNIDGVMIEDIGTAFNVKAIPGSNKIEVVVENGEVHFYTPETEGLNLVKGEKAVYDLNTKAFVKSVPGPVENTTSYMSKVFHFKGTTLNEVVAQVNEVYGSDIKLADEKMGNCRLSVVFNNENVDVIVSIIAETLDLEIQRSGNSITLKGAACAE